MSLEIKIAKEVAEADVENWLDFKKIKDNEREEKAAFINTLVYAVMYGNIAIDNETYEITQTLDFPKDSLTSIKYKARGGTGELQSKTANLKGVSMGVYIAYASALSGQLVATLNRIDSEDFKVLQAITTFFL